MHRTLLGLLAVILLGIGAWIGFGSPSVSEEAKESSLAHDTRASARAGVDEGETPQGRAEESPVERETAPVASEGDLPSDFHDFQVIVVAHDDLRPLPDAEVYLQEDPRLNPVWDYHLMGPVPASMLQTEVEGILGPFLTDADGSASIPRPSPGQMIIARYGEAIGFRIQDRGRSLREGMLKVHPERTLRVRAVHPDGEPAADQTVCLYLGYQHVQPMLTAVTDPQGVALFHMPRMHLGGNTLGEFHLGIAGSGLAPTEGPFAFRRIPQDLEIEVRPTSQWTFRLQYADGTPYARTGWVSLTGQGPSPNTEQSWMIPEEQQGVMVLDGLAPETEFSIMVVYRDSRSRVEFTRVSPAAGQQEEIAVRMEEEVEHLFVEIQDAAGEVLADQAVHLSVVGFDRTEGRLQATELTTGPRGSVRWPMPKITGEHQQRFVNRILRAEAQLGEAEVPHTGEIGFGEELFGADIPVVIRMEPDPLLAGGVVLDDQGRPVPDQDVRALQADDDFWPDHYGNARTDASGRFRITGRPPPGLAELVVNLPGQDAASVPLDVGSDAHVLKVLETPFQIRGLILLPPHDGRSEILFDQGGQQRRIRTSYRDGIVPFDTRLLEQTPGRLIYRIRGFGEIAALEGIAPTGLDAPQDPRLHPWDLREAVSLAEVEVFLGTETIDGYSISVEETGDRSGNFQNIKISTEEGERFLVPHGLPIQARLSGSRLWTTAITIRPGKQAVQAQAAALGSFRLLGDPILPENVRLTLTGRKDRPTRLERSFRERTSPDWEVEFQTAGFWTGRIRLEYHPDGEVKGSAYLKLDGGSEDTFAFEVPADGSPFTVDIPFDQGELDRTIAELREKTGG